MTVAEGSAAGGGLAPFVLFQLAQRLELGLELARLRRRRPMSRIGMGILLVCSSVIEASRRVRGKDCRHSAAHCGFLRSVDRVASV